MLQTVKISSKRQVTIPAKFFEKLNLKRGDRLIFELNDNCLTIKRTLSLVDELAGSIGLPKKYQKISLDDLVRQARDKHFRKKA